MTVAIGRRLTLRLYAAVSLTALLAGCAVGPDFKEPDFKDLLRLMNKHRVRYLIVGGYAAMKYTEPFYTKVMDIWIDATSGNARRTYQALVEFGAPMADLTVQ